MKWYESASGKTRLTGRTPVLIRLDGRAFHTLCKGMERPWDRRFYLCMGHAAKALCESASGVSLAYFQSDEITLVLSDEYDIKSKGWFDYVVQKICSVSASIVTAAFNKAYREHFPNRRTRNLPTFDARVWNVPHSEVTNSLIWRQQDAEKNSLSMSCQAYYTTKELHGIRRSGLHDLLYKKGLNWSHFPTPQKRGATVVRRPYEVRGATRHRWIVDEEVPIFSTQEGRNYLDDLYPWLKGE